MRIKTKIRLCQSATAVLCVCEFCCFAALVVLGYLFATEGFFEPLVELPRMVATAIAVGGLFGSIAALGWLDKTEFDLLAQQAQINDFYKKLYNGGCLR